MTSSGVKPIHRAAAVHRAQRRAGAKVAGHRPKSLDRTVEQLRGAARGVAVGQAVEAVPAKAPPAAPVRRQCVGGRRVRQVGVEGGVEAGHRGHRGQRGRDRVDAGDGPWLVQRCQIGQCHEPLADPPVEHRGLGELGAAVHHPMTHQLHATSRRQAGQELPYRLQVVGAPWPEFHGCQRVVVLVEQRQLEAGRAGVVRCPPVRVDHLQPVRAVPAGPFRHVALFHRRSTWSTVPAPGPGGEMT